MDLRIVSVLFFVTFFVCTEASVGDKAKNYCETSRQRDNANLQEETAHLALLGMELKNARREVCGGVLIAPKYVLTTAHCTKPPNGDLRYVHLGDPTYENDTKRGDPQDFNIVRTFKHPNYEKGKQEYDLGVVELDREVKISDYVYPACLQIEDTIPTSDWSATGWSILDKSRKSAPRAEAIKFKNVEPDTCEKDLSNIVKITENMICAIYEKDDQSCVVESGSPLQYKNAQPKSGYTVIGISAFGRVCIQGGPVAFTRVSKLIPWIESVVWA